MTQTEDQLAAAAGSFRKQEPAILTHLISGPALGLATLFGTGHADKLAAQITAGAVALAIVLQGFLLRRGVAPAWKLVTGNTSVPSAVSAVLDEMDPDPAPDWGAEIHAMAESAEMAARLAGAPQEGVSPTFPS